MRAVVVEIHTEPGVARELLVPGALGLLEVAVAERELAQRETTRLDDPDTGKGALGSRLTAVLKALLGAVVDLVVDQGLEADLAAEQNVASTDAAAHIRFDHVARVGLDPRGGSGLELEKAIASAFLEPASDTDLRFQLSGIAVRQDVDRSARRVAGRSGCEVLGHDEAGDDVGGEEIELHGLFVGVRARDRRAVVERAAVAILETPDDRELPLDDVDAGDALERVRHVGRRELRKLFRAEQVDQLIGLLALFDRAEQIRGRGAVDGEVDSTGPVSGVRSPLHPLRPSRRRAVRSRSRRGSPGRRPPRSPRCWQRRNRLSGIRSGSDPPAPRRTRTRRCCRWC